MLEMQERMKAVSIDINLLARTYFYFDEPVIYKLDKYDLQIFPITVKQSEFFLHSIGLFSVDKNSAPNVEIIQMSYLKFILSVLIPADETNLSKFTNLLSLCLHMEDPRIQVTNANKINLIEGEGKYLINEQQFEDIRRIILYQNLIRYDDTYINPELKKAIQETDELKNKDIDYPNIERKMAIITAHTGLSKREQMNMTYRSHSLLFDEVYNEVDFTTIRPVVAFSGNDSKLEHWIFKKKKNKMDKYITQVDKYAQSMGSNQNAIHIANTNNQLGSQYLQQFNNFNK